MTSIPLCDMCEQRPAETAVTVQTIPGSLDTKFVEMVMCQECADGHQAFQVRAWSQAKQQERDSLRTQLAQARAEIKELDDVLTAWGERARELLESQPDAVDSGFFVVSMAVLLK